MEISMKLKPPLAASLFAIMAALAFNANAAADTPTDAKVEKTTPKKKMKPHSHMEEKTGIAQRTPDAKPDKSSAAKDKTKHFHPRDGK
jgi:hypothetical protein